MIDSPTLLPSSCATTRATRSVPPPAAAGTRIRSCLDGNDCARPACGSIARPPRAAERNSDRRCIETALRTRRCDAGHDTRSVAYHHHLAGGFIGLHRAVRLADLL